MSNNEIVSVSFRHNEKHVVPEGLKQTITTYATKWRQNVEIPLEKHMKQSITCPQCKKDFDISVMSRNEAYKYQIITRVMGSVILAVICWFGREEVLLLVFMLPCLLLAIGTLLFVLFKKKDGLAPWHLIHILGSNSGQKHEVGTD